MCAGFFANQRNSGMESLGRKVAVALGADRRLVPQYPTNRVKINPGIDHLASRAVSQVVQPGMAEPSRPSSSLEYLADCPLGWLLRPQGGVAYDVSHTRVNWDGVGLPILGVLAAQLKHIAAIDNLGKADLGRPHAAVERNADDSPLLVGLLHHGLCPNSQALRR